MRPTIDLAGPSHSPIAQWDIAVAQNLPLCLPEAIYVPRSHWQPDPPNLTRPVEYLDWSLQAISGHSLPVTILQTHRPLRRLAYEYT
jgi:hypothetical protein